MWGDQNFWGGQRRGPVFQWDNRGDQNFLRVNEGVPKPNGGPEFFPLSKGRGDQLSQNKKENLHFGILTSSDQFSGLSLVTYMVTLQVI